MCLLSSEGADEEKEETEETVISGSDGTFVSTNLMNNSAQTESDC